MSGLFHNYGPDPNKPLLHASAVALDGRGVLIVGHSGSGKSSLAMRLMVLGADLVADDRVYVASLDDQLHLRRPERIANRVEAYGVGLIDVASIEGASLEFIINLSNISENRMPLANKASILGIERPIFNSTGNSNFTDAVYLMLRNGIADATIR